MRKLFAVVLGGCLGIGVAIAPVSAQAVPKQPIFESLRLRSGFTNDPEVLRGVSGGDRKAMDALVADTPTGACLGYIDQHADHRLELLTYFSYLKLAVDSKGDTVLAVRGPGGIWCSDDSQDQNPVIAGEWQKGSYEVWVGSREARTFHRYVLEITQVK
ncbi:MAG: hypothetical protein HC799_13310 [Limnothrix sp. RL_2_0]|nr:hypothetical protein [Limnothrix sp. RL_2_0]